MGFRTDSVLVYFMSERHDHLSTVQVEAEHTLPDGTLVSASFEVADEEPDDVFGPIFSRVLEELGFWLDDPGDFAWTEVETEHGLEYIVDINSTYTLS